MHMSGRGPEAFYLPQADEALEWRFALAGDGVGTTRARRFDTRGTLGEALQSLFVAPQ
jgi:hypothetical protein